MEVNEREKVIYAQPTTVDERNEAAEACSLGLDLKMPTLLDEMNNEVDEAYAALPDRLYLIDEVGRIAYRSERGPRGFRPDEFEAAIESHMAIAASGRRFSA